MTTQQKLENIAMAVGAAIFTIATLITDIPLSWKVLIAGLSFAFSLHLVYEVAKQLNWWGAGIRAPILIGSLGSFVFATIFFIWSFA